MDIVTHAISGALIAYALPQRPKVRFGILFFALAACVPDLDILFCTTPALFLNLHRGISHSIFVAPLLALLLALLAYPLRRASTPQAFSLRTLWLLSLVCLLVHIALDCITTYGTMIFLPFSDFRVRLNAVFIVDVFLTLPLLVLFCICAFKRIGCRKIACAGLVWMVLYPGLCLALSSWAGHSLAGNLRAQGRTIHELVLLPDFFTPLYWRALYVEEQDGHNVEQEQSISGLGSPRGPACAHTPLSREEILNLSAQSAICRDFFDLMLMPVVRPLSEHHRKAALTALSFLPMDTQGQDTARQSSAGTGHVMHPLADHVARELKFLLVYDLRFGSGLTLGRKLLGSRPRANIPFRLMVVLDRDNTVLLERIVFSDARKDSGWKSPTPPAPQTFGQWLLGLH